MCGEMRWTQPRSCATLASCSASIAALLMSVPEMEGGEPSKALNI